jgi:hypothetical protein
MESGYTHRQHPIPKMKTKQKNVRQNFRSKKLAVSASYVEKANMEVSLRTEFRSATARSRNVISADSDRFIVVDTNKSLFFVSGTAIGARTQVKSAQESEIACAKPASYTGTYNPGLFDS